MNEQRVFVCGDTIRVIDVTLSDEMDQAMDVILKRIKHLPPKWVDLLVVAEKQGRPLVPLAKKLCDLSAAIKND